MIGASAHCAEGYCAEILVYRADAATYKFIAPSTATRSVRTKGAYGFTSLRCKAGFSVDILICQAETRPTKISPLRVAPKAPTYIDLHQTESGE